MGWPARVSHGPIDLSRIGTGSCMNADRIVAAFLSGMGRRGGPCRVARGKIRPFDVVSDVEPSYCAASAACRRHMPKEV